MPTEEKRGQELLDSAKFIEDFLNASPGIKDENIWRQAIHNMRKYVQICVDRDAGANLEHRSKITDLETQLDVQQRAGADLTIKLAKAVDAGAALVAQIDPLKTALKKNLEGLPADYLKTVTDLANSETVSVADAAGVIEKK